jgi:tetratricopeptide (TPR) repeat protein
MSFRLGTVTLLLLLPAFGCEPTAQSYHAEGLAEYRAGDYESARGMFKAALLEKPEQQESAYYLARCCRIAAERKFDEGDYAGALRELDEAVFYYGQAIESYPGYAAAVEEKSEALRLKGRYAEALRLSIWAKDNTGRTVRQLVNVAHEFEQVGDVDMALMRYRQAVAVEPDNALAHAELGRFLARQKRYAAAVRALRDAYRLDPSEPGVVADLATYEGLIADEARPASTPIEQDGE